MPLNKFGQSLQGHLNTNSILSKLQHTKSDLKYTIDGNIDAGNLKICNVKSPTLNGDATNRQYVEEKIIQLSQDTLKPLRKFKQDILKAIQKFEQDILDFKNDYKQSIKDLKKQLDDITIANAKLCVDIDKKYTNLEKDLNYRFNATFSDIVLNNNKVEILRKKIDELEKKLENNYNDDRKPF